MAIYRCKACGAPLEIKAGLTVIECEHCEVSNTLPKLENDKKANLIDRANHFRRSNEFDKAAALYEEVLREDSTDAEIYWSLVLCHYGIEYVEDPTSHKRMPTVNRAQFTAIYDDENYKSALQHADNEQKSVYEEEAKAINEIQKQILSISQNEEPFDVFICYKQSDEKGERTRDSLEAYNLYDRLTKEGFKVFYAAITLEDKLGVAYEPYIFAALNSARVMVVVATKKDYVNAVWVKNEWSRYLSLIKGGAKKTLIPAYRDMDPYDLPEEFSHLQAQDLNKIGCLEDLTRGIKKILDADKPKETNTKTVFISSGNQSTPQSEALLKRAFMFLEDGDWKNANAYCEKVLDTDPENALAYLGKLMADLKVRNEAELRAREWDFTNNPLLLKALRFASPELKDKLSKIAENCKKNDMYGKAIGCMNVGSIIESPDPDEVEKDGVEKISQYEQAIRIFEQIIGFKDSTYQIQLCQDKIFYIKSKIQEAKEAELADIEYRNEVAKAEQQRKKKKKLYLTTGIISVVAIIIIAGFIYKTAILPANEYKEALALQEQEEYFDALVQFDELEHIYKKDYSDEISTCENELYNFVKTSQDGIKMREFLYDMESQKTTGYYEDSLDKWIALYDTYRDSLYERASDSYSKIEYAVAGVLFDALDDYKDSEQKFSEIAKLKEYQISAPIGATIVLGKYEQDFDSENGPEDIEWLILDKTGDKILLLSKYVLDEVDFKSSKDSSINYHWSDSNVRLWLNETFYNTAFNDSEKKHILLTNVAPDVNPYSPEMTTGKATEDKVFLLSMTEVDRYFPEDSPIEWLTCYATAYAYAQTFIYPDGYDETDVSWGLRSPAHIKKSIFAGGDDYGYACVDLTYYVRSDGYTAIRQNSANESEGPVRPAMWINLND